MWTEADGKRGPDEKWLIEHILTPQLREDFQPPKRFSDNGAVVQIASCENLYKIFERC